MLQVTLKANKPLHTWHEVDAEFHLVVWEDSQPGVACGGVLGYHRFLTTADTWLLHWQIKAQEHILTKDKSNRNDKNCIS